MDLGLVLLEGALIFGGVLMGAIVGAYLGIAAFFFEREHRTQQESQGQ